MEWQSHDCVGGETERVAICRCIYQLGLGAGLVKVNAAMPCHVSIASGLCHAPPESAPGPERVSLLAGLGAGMEYLIGTGPVSIFLIFCSSWLSWGEAVSRPLCMPVQ